MFGRSTKRHAFPACSKQSMKLTASFGAKGKEQPNKHLAVEADISCAVR